jgi:hypothetical protein
LYLNSITIRKASLQSTNIPIALLSRRDLIFLLIGVIMSRMKGQSIPASVSMIVILGIMLMVALTMVAIGAVTMSVH